MSSRPRNLAALQKMLHRSAAKIVSVSPLKARPRERRSAKGSMAALAWDLPSEQGREREHVRLDLKMPPALSRCFTNVPGVGRVKTKVYRLWIAEALDTIGRARVGRVSGKVTVVVAMRRRPRADADNRLKALGDILQTAGIIRDDSLVDAWHVAWADTGRGVRMLVRPFRQEDLVDPALIGQPGDDAR